MQVYVHSKSSKCLIVHVVYIDLAVKVSYQELQYTIQFRFGTQTVVTRDTTLCLQCVTVVTEDTTVCFQDLNRKLS